jgi:hypothetical protein
MGLSITVNAAKPIREQTIKSAPLAGAFHECLAMNDTQDNLVVSMSFHHLRTLIAIQIELFPEETLDLPQKGGGDRYCVVSWVGQPDDVRASYCTWEDEAKTVNKACIELY